MVQKRTVDTVIVLSGRDAGREFPLTESDRLIGSDPECAIRLEDPGVKPKHARLSREHGVWFLRAFEGDAFIEIDGRLLAEMRIDHASQFRIGSVQCRFATPRAVIEMTPAPDETGGDPEKAVAALAQAREAILSEMAKVIIGQRGIMTQILVSLFARGHCLLIGAPGLAKTLMVRTLAGTLDLGAKRIQFTPDLMPADITGTDILEEDAVTGRRRFRFNKGPLFTNMLLADEINRTPPKTQAALLEAMQEQTVTAAGITYSLPRPFLVLATQNPIELEGTYPLPEAQLDRFMFSLVVEYPGAADEAEIIVETTRDRPLEVERLMDAETILKFQNLVRQVPVSRHVAAYAAALVRATRPGQEGALDFVTRWVRWGAGPRAGQFLLLAAKAGVILNGRFNVSCRDVREFALPVLRHRIFPNFTAASEGVTADEIVRRIVAAVREPDY